MEKRILRLPLKKEWYEMIESGTKTEEYREIAKYWISRCCENKQATPEDVIAGKEQLREYDEALFSFGYTTRTMTFEVESITVGTGKKEWGAPEEPAFIIKLGKRVDEQEVKEDDAKTEVVDEPKPEPKPTPEVVVVKKPETHTKEVSQKYDITDLVKKYQSRSNWVTVTTPQITITPAGRIIGSTLKISYKTEYPMCVHTLQYTIDWVDGDTDKSFYDKVNTFLSEKSAGLYTIVLCNGVNYVPGKYLKINLYTINTNDKTRGAF